MQVTPAIASSTQSDPGGIPVPTQMLSQQDFLNLLVTQMTSQDPLNPINNQDMLTQMVQFSTLDANTSLQAKLLQMQTSQAFTEANSLLGRQVTLQVDPATTTQGTVTGVDASTGSPQIVVNGQSYDLGQIVLIANPPTSP